MRTLLIYLCLGLGLSLGISGNAHADDRRFRLSAPQDLVDAGLLAYMLPRFSLKTQVRIEIVAEIDGADAGFGDRGTPVFTGLGTTYRLQLRTPDHPGVVRFERWLLSEIGQRTIVGFRKDSVQVFAPPIPETVVEAALDIDGDAAMGKDLSHAMCGRCHVVSEETRMTSIGSTPSFFALRSLSDWSERFAAFYALNPHPSFTQIKDVTEGFAEDRPPPISPLEMTLSDLDSITAYVALLDPADLGAPLQHQ